MDFLWLSMYSFSLSLCACVWSFNLEQMSEEEHSICTTHALFPVGSSIFRFVCLFIYICFHDIVQRLRDFTFSSWIQATLLSHDVMVLKLPHKKFPCSKSKYLSILPKPWLWQKIRYIKIHSNYFQLSFIKELLMEWCSQM